MGTCTPRNQALDRDLRFGDNCCPGIRCLQDSLGGGRDWTPLPRVSVVYLTSTLNTFYSTMRTRFPAPFLSVFWTDSAQISRRLR